MNVCDVTHNQLEYIIIGKEHAGKKTGGSPEDIGKFGGKGVSEEENPIMSRDVLYTFTHNLERAELFPEGP